MTAKKNTSYREIVKFIRESIAEARAEVTRLCRPPETLDLDHLENLRAPFFTRPDAHGNYTVIYRFQKKKSTDIEHVMAKRAVILVERAESALSELEKLGNQVGRPTAARLFAAAYEFGTRLTLFDHHGEDIAGYNHAIRQFNRDVRKTTAGEEYRRALEAQAQASPIGFHSAVKIVAERFDVERKTVGDNPVVRAMDRSIFQSSGGRPRGRSKPRQN